MPFELEERKVSGIYGRHATPIATISKRGECNLSRDVPALIGGELRYVHLYYDPDTRRIGIQPVEEESPASYRIHDSRKLTLAGLLGGRGIELDGTRHYPVRYEEGMLVIPLNEPLPAQGEEGL